MSNLYVFLWFPLTRMSDEIRSADDIISFWHIDPQVAEDMFNLFNDIVFDENSENDLIEESETSDDDSDDETDHSSGGE